MVKREIISVIVPIYNVEKYLAKCLDSLLAQTYTKLEILLLDDGSTDRSGEICDSYAEKDNRIKVIHRENKGVAYTRNEGLDLAQGEYITFLDSDDYIHPQMYELMLQSMLRQQAQIVMCDYKRVQEKEKTDAERTVSHEEIEEKQEVFQTKQDKLNLVYLKHYGESTLVWNKIYRREVWDGIRCPVGKVYEDETLTFRALYYAEKIIYIHEEFYYYVKRQNNTSLMDLEFSPKRLLRLDALEYRIDFYIQKQEWRYLAEAMFAYKTDFLVIMGHIRNHPNYTMDILKPYLKKYRQYCKKYLTRLEIPFKKKIQYVFFAVAPQIYYDRYQKGTSKKK